MIENCISENCSELLLDSRINYNLKFLNSTWDSNFRDSTRFWVQYVMLPFVLAVGLVGNILSVFILTRKTMRSSSNIYLTALALSDLIFLIFSFTMSWKHYKFMDRVWLYWKYFPIGLWITDASCSTSVWITVAFTAERYIAVCYPMMGKAYRTEKRAKYTAIFVSIACVLLTASTPFEWKLVAKLPDQADTSISENTSSISNELSSLDMVYVLENTELGESSHYRFFFNWMTILLFVIVPFSLLSILNFLLINAVRKSRAVRESMTPAPLQQQLRLQNMRREDRITVTLISVVIMFLVCQMPTAAVLIYTAMNKPAEHESSEENILLGLGNICNLLVTVNAACNFLLYTALSDKYRRNFLNIFVCKWSLLRQNRIRNGNNERGPVLVILRLQLEQNDLANDENGNIQSSTANGSSGNENLPMDKLTSAHFLAVRTLTLSMDETGYLPVSSARLVLKRDVHSD